MTKRDPAVSVLMPVYNGERYLAQAVEGILSQTFGDFEFIIVDDGSTDGTPEILAQFNDERIVRLCHPANKGYVHALNWGLEVARGRYLARQDADDISLPDRLAREVHLLEEQPRVVLVGSAYHTIDETGAHLRTYCPPTDDMALRWHLLFQNAFVHSAVMARFEVIRKNGLRYDPDLAPAEDFALWSRLLELGEGANIQDPLVKRRIHGRQVGQLQAERQRRNADLTSRANLERLGVRLDDETLRVLRDWQFRFPRPFTRGEMAKFRHSLTVMEAFGRRGGIDERVLKEIRRRWIRRTLAHISMKHWPRMAASGLLAGMFGVEPATTLHAFAAAPFTRLAARRARAPHPGSPTVPVA